MMVSALKLARLSHSLIEGLAHAKGADLAARCSMPPTMDTCLDVLDVSLGDVASLRELTQADRNAVNEVLGNVANCVVLSRFGLTPDSQGLLVALHLRAADKHANYVTVSDKGGSLG